MMKQQQLSTGTYVFSSQPKAIRKYRDRKAEQEGNGPSYWNIMFDPRVVRGNTYALNQYNGVDPLEEQKQREQRRKDLVKKRAKQLQQNLSRTNQKSPLPVDGRVHVELQTEQYLEELSERVVETDNCCQTDEFLERPPTPLFVPAKIGLDVETQIYDGELFDFDLEVRPLVEVLIGKTLEQALVETMEEEELAMIRNQQSSFEELRNAELVEMQRLEEKDRRHREEKEKRLRQEQEMLNAERDTADIIASHAFARGFLADLIPSVFQSLADNGYFSDAVQRELDSEFMPWLMDGVAADVKMMHLSRALLDDIIMNVVDERATAFVALQQQEQQQEQQREQQQQQIQSDRIATPQQISAEEQSQDNSDDEANADVNTDRPDVQNNDVIDTIVENEEDE